jgi:two-component sensor histidine kinase
MAGRLELLGQVGPVAGLTAGSLGAGLVLSWWHGHGATARRAGEADRRRQAEEALAASRGQAQRLEQQVADREVLVRETNHRVRNNLQVVSSLLELQAGEAGSPRPTVDTLRQAAGRVRAMAGVHERLYRSARVEELDLGAYVQDLAHNAVACYPLDPTAIELIVDVESLPVGPNLAVPLGLAVNELLANAVFHGFPDGRRGTLRVGLQQRDREFVLTVADDGVGLPAGFDLSTLSTMGLKTVQALTRQARGTMSVEPGNGTTIRLAVPLPA